MRARIYQPARNAMQSGTAKTKGWVLEFAPASSREVDPLMGWTSTTDTTTQVKLRFDSREAAEDYARAQGIEFLDGPNTVTEGPLAGFNWIYFNAPWGQSLEIASFSSLGYEKDTPERLWRAKPAD